MIFIRADGNAQIGSGHIMRCLSLAVELKKTGEEVLFVLADSSFQMFVEQKGFQTYILQTNYREMEAELPVLLEVMHMKNPTQMIVDSYDVTDHYLNTVRDVCEITYFDDFGTHAHPVDRLINYNIYGERIPYEKLYKECGGSPPELILGPAYTPLREEFQKIPLRKQNRNCHDILVSTGGSDTIHFARNMIVYIKEHEKELSSYTFHFLVGAMNVDADVIEQYVQELEHVVIHRNVVRMRELMESCDVAVSAAGSTLYELCACGIPTITYVLADNQMAGAEEFQRREIMESLGDIRIKDDIYETLCNRLDELNRHYDKRVEKAILMQHTVDGLGASRIVDKMIKR